MFKWILRLGCVVIVPIPLLGLISCNEKIEPDIIPPISPDPEEPEIPEPPTPEINKPFFSTSIGWKLTEEESSIWEIQKYESELIKKFKKWGDVLADGSGSDKEIIQNSLIKETVEQREIKSNFLKEVLTSRYIEGSDSLEKAIEDNVMIVYSTKSEETNWFVNKIVIKFISNDGKLVHNNTVFDELNPSGEKAKYLTITLA